MNRNIQVETNFAVVSVSKNTNAFGLTGIIILALTGEAYEVAYYNAIDPLKKGDKVSRIDTFNPEEKLISKNWTRNFEIPRELPKATPEQAREFWNELGLL